MRSLTHNSQLEDTVGRFLESDEYYRTRRSLPVLEVQNLLQNACRNQFETKTSNGALDDGDGTQTNLNELILKNFNESPIAVV